MHDPRYEPGLGLIYQMDATPGRHTQALMYAGGPVEPLVFSMLLRSPEPPADTLPIQQDLYFVFGTDSVLARLAAGGGGTLRVFAGYAGWSSGQLQAEIRAGSWHVIAADPGRLLAADPQGLWRRLVDGLEGRWI